MYQEDNDQPRRAKRRKRVISKTNHSIVSNGSREFYEVDGRKVDMRSARGRRYRDIRDNLQYELRTAPDTKKWQT